MTNAFCQMTPGDRFYIADAATHTVHKAGVIRPDGGADIDLDGGRHHEPPFTVTADELSQMYDPAIHIIGTLGTAV